MPWPPLLREVAKKRLGHVIFLEHHIGQKGTPFPPDDIEADWDAIVPVKPLAHLAQCISKLLPFETNLDLVHCRPALPETPPPFSNSQTAVRLRSVHGSGRLVAARSVQP